MIVMSAVSAGIGIAVVAVTIALLALLVHGLRSLDRETILEAEAAGREPDWWPEFEREFADHVARRSGESPVD